MADDTASPDRPRPISRRLRFEILRRDSHTCRYCGAQAPDVPLTVDHVIPRVLGGSDDPNNLVAACGDCNSGKASVAPDSALVADVDAASFLFASAMERAAAILAEQREATDALLERFLGSWRTWTWTAEDGTKHTLAMAPGWQGAVERWTAAGLTIDDLERLIPVAMRSTATHAEKWRYFCGCAWRTLTDRQELARRLIEDGVV